MRSIGPTRSAAVYLAVTAVIVSLAAALVQVVFVVELATRGLGWVSTVATAGLAPALTLAALCALLRSWGLISSPRAALSATVGALAFASAAAGLLAFSVGFDDVDAGREPSGFARLLVPFVLAATLFGVTAATPLLEAVLRRPRGAVKRWALSVVLAAIACLVLAVSLVTPTVAVIAAVVILAVALRSSPQSGAREPSVSSSMPMPPRPLGVVTRERAAASRALAWGSVILGGAAAVVALTGSSYLAGLDATETMRLGIGIGIVAALPLLVSVDLVLVARVPFRATTVHVALALCAAALLGTAAASFLPEFLQWNMILLGALFLGAAVGVAAYALLPGSGPSRILVGAAIGGGFGVTLGIAVVAASSFIAPVLALVWALTGTRPREAAVRPKTPVTVS
ncbi:hypothetical protein [Naasia sp.]|uniref:hypothetical protein n=1 Tax=Naasia sp. TaxID=2546198 RepID=UPI0026032D5E|nr:hypothetical protein [Naasia sp.]